jgi:hypothetical protein
MKIPDGPKLWPHLPGTDAASDHLAVAEQRRGETIPRVLHIIRTFIANARTLQRS